MRYETAMLLGELDSLAVSDRMRFLAARARELVGSRELRAFLDDLSAGDRFQRQTAVFLATVAEDRAAIAAALADPDWEVRRPALTEWLRSGTPSARQLTVFVSEAPWCDRQHVYRGLRRLRGADLAERLADSLIGPVLDRFGDDEASRLLPACSAPVLARLLPALAHAVGSWPVLGTRFPEAVLDAAEAELAGLSGPDEWARWWHRAGEGVLAAGAVLPPRVLDLLERYVPANVLPGPLRYYTALAAADHARLLAFLTARSRSSAVSAARFPGSLLRLLSRLETAELTPLARRLTYPEHSLVALLRAVPPSRRGALYEAAYQDTERVYDRPSLDMLAVLPRPVRWTEARRVLNLGQVREETALTRGYTAFLPWDEAKPALTEATRSAEAGDRADGYALLAECAGRDGRPGSVSEAVEYFRRLRNEQDPVRSSALAALAEVPPRLLEPETAEALTQITADALAVRDTSAGARNALTALAVAVLRDRYDCPPLAGWALRTVTEIFGDRTPRLGRVDTRLRRGQEREFFASVRDWLDAGMRRGSWDPLFAVARALGRRAWNLPELQDMLRRAAGPENTTATARAAMTLWLEDRRTRSQRAAELLAADPSVVAVAESRIWDVLCLHRTDLLDGYLTGTPPRGRFLADGVRWTPLYSPGTSRWLPRQQAAYARLLAAVAADAGAKTYERTEAITAAAPLGDEGRAVVRRHLDGSSIPLVEAALAVLPRTGNPREALPVLLAHGGGDRARVAVYAAGQAARLIPPGELAALLTAEPVMTGKITTRKEALRLVAALSVPGAGDVLLAAWNRPGQHRDVRAAAVSAARQCPRDPLSWTILREAAAAGPAEARAVIPTGSPLSVEPRYRDQYGDLIAAVCRHPDRDTARLAWSVTEFWGAWLPDLGALITRQLTDLDEPALWGSAVRPLLLLTASGTGAVLSEVVVRLAGLDREPSGPADLERDRPARRRLDAVVRHADMFAVARQQVRAPIAEAGRRLASQADFTRQAACLLIAGVHRGPGQGERLTADLSEVCDLLADTPAIVPRVTEVLTRQVQNGRGDKDTLLTAITALAAEPRASAGLLAVALAAQGARHGWPAPWRAQVRRLRAHAKPDVRAAALDLDLSAG